MRRVASHCLAERKTRPVKGRMSSCKPTANMQTPGWGCSSALVGDSPRRRYSELKPDGRRCEAQSYPAREKLFRMIDYHTRFQVPVTQDLNSNLVSMRTNDRNILNPSGRISRDGGGKISNQLLKCKTPTLFSTFNARTLSKVYRLLEIISCVKQQIIDVLSIQEHRLNHPDIDILTRKKWRNSVTNCQAYSSFLSVGSDHRVISCIIRLSLDNRRNLFQIP